MPSENDLRRAVENILLLDDADLAWLLGYLGVGPDIFATRKKLDVIYAKLKQ